MNINIDQDTVFARVNNKTIEVVNEKVVQDRVEYSYDRILNDIQEYEEKLANLYKLKDEADKLGLIR